MLAITSCCLFSTCNVMTCKLNLAREPPEHRNYLEGKCHGVIDTAEIVSAVAMTPLKFGQKNYVVDVPMKLFILSSS
jgi:hypothetical protein